MNKKTSLASLINKRALTIFTATISLLIGVVMYFFIQEALEGSNLYGDLALQNGASKIETTIESYKSITKSVSSTIKAELVLPEKERSRIKIISVLESVLFDFDDLVGVYVLFEENKFDNNDKEFKNKEYHDETGRFIPYVNFEKIEPAYGYESFDYYQKCKQTQSLFITNPYEYEINHKIHKIISISYPIITNNEFVGIVGIDLSLETLNEEAAAIDIYNRQATTALLDSKGNYLTHSHKKELIGQNLSVDTDNPETRMKFLQDGVLDHWFEDLGFTGVIGCITAPIKLNETQTPWQLQAKVHSKYVFVRLIEAIWWIIIILIVSVVATIYLLKKSITTNLKPLVALQEICNEIANGNLTREIDIQSDNEIGLLVDAYKKMRQNLNEFINKIKDSANSINVASVQLKDSSQGLSESSSEQASVTEEISSNIEEMTASVQEVAAKSGDIITQSDEILLNIKNVSDEAVESNQLQEEVVEAVGIINDIAQNIRILALNAAVEAARAGENGKGFTVVAREVQKLSERTSITVKDIVEKTNETFKKSEQSTIILKGMLKKFSIFNDHMQNVNLAVQEQSQGVQQISAGTVSLNQTTQANASSAEELSSTSEELNTQATELSDLTKGFKTN